ALGVREAPGRTLEESLADYLREKRLLLLADNFEHVLAAAPLLSELLRAAPGLKLLVTSREALRLRAEREFPLAPLGVPPLGPAPAPEAVGAYASAALFAERARAARPDFRIDAGN